MPRTRTRIVQINRPMRGKPMPISRTPPNPTSRPLEELKIPPAIPTITTAPTVITTEVLNRRSQARATTAETNPGATIPVEVPPADLAAIIPVAALPAIAAPRVAPLREVAARGRGNDSLWYPQETQNPDINNVKQTASLHAASFIPPPRAEPVTTLLWSGSSRGGHAQRSHPATRHLAPSFQ